MATIADPDRPPTRSASAAAWIARRTGCRRLNAAYGNRIDGVDPAEQDATAIENLRLAAQAAFADLLDAAIGLGGTVSGEHGIGLLKRDGMRRELDPGALAMQEAVRRALDPSGVFNPGKG